MEYTISSRQLAVTISSHGAELLSIRGANGVEYLWQGDPAYWTSHAPNIFPYVARLTEGKYTLYGREYGFGNHGLVRYEDLEVEEENGRGVTFRLESNPRLREQYPFDFVYRIRYEVAGKRLMITTTVENRGLERMFFAVGGHPGFNVPLNDDLAFTDYCLEFDQEAHPYRVFLADSGAVTPRQIEFAMEGNRRVPLSHDLFDHDAIVLHHAAKTVTIKPDTRKMSAWKNAANLHTVTVSFPDFRYVGFWHKPRTDAPYVCVEPWTSLPSREGIIEDLALQADLLHLDGGGKWSTKWWIEVD